MRGLNNIGGEGAITNPTLTTFLASVPASHGPLLPNIDELEWSSFETQDFMGFVIPFVSTSLRLLYMANRSTEQTGLPIRRTIGLLATMPNISLSDFTLDDTAEDDPSLPEAVALLLNSQTSLTSLTLYCRGVTAQSPVTISISHLHQLRHLHTSLQFSTLADLERALSSIVIGCPLIERIVLTVKTTPEIEQPLHFQAFKTLLGVGHLRYLSLDYGGKILVEDQDIARMGQSWPQIEVLSLHSAIPISSLAIFAQYFSPTLHTLQLPLTCPNPPLFSDQTPRFHSLQNLTPFGDIPQEMEVAVGAFLSWVCPAGVKIRHASSWMSTADSGWNRIVQIMEAGHHLQEASRQAHTHGMEDLERE